jgi:hypothetical protein
MGVPTSEVGYTSATPRRGDHEVHKGHVVTLKGGGYIYRKQEQINIQLCHAHMRAATEWGPI